MLVSTHARTPRHLFLCSLVTLDFSINQLTGTIPSGIGLWDSLGKFQEKRILMASEASKNSLAFPVFQSEDLILSSNMLSGTIPDQLFTSSALYRVFLDRNQLNGTIPTESSGHYTLEVLDLSFNRLTGEIPSEIGKFLNLEVLYLNNNMLVGAVPSELGLLEASRRLKLDLTGNDQLEPPLPDEVVSLCTEAFNTFCVLPRDLGGDGEEA